MIDAFSLHRLARFLTLILVLFLIGCAKPSANSKAAREAGHNETPTLKETPTTKETLAQTGNNASPVDRAEPTTPDELVRQFYNWYLSELRAGKEPFKDDEKLKLYFTEAFISEQRAHQLPKFDPILGLPRPESDWYNMKVEIGKPKYYHKKPLHDAYVDVRYKGFVDRGAEVRNGTKFTTIVDQWVIGLQRTDAGWRIASIGIPD